MTIFRYIISALYLSLISRIQRRLCQLADGMLNHLSVAVHGQEALITDQFFESWKYFLACNGPCSPGGQTSKNWIGRFHIRKEVRGSMVGIMGSAMSQSADSPEYPAL